MIKLATDFLKGKSIQAFLKILNYRSPAKLDIPISSLV